MKKLLILALVSQLAVADDGIIDSAKDVAKQFADVVVEPAVAVKDTVATTIKDNEIDSDFVDVVSAYPKFFVERAEAVANSKFAKNVKEATNKAVDATKKAYNATKDAGIKAFDATKDAMTTAKDNTVKAFKTTKDAVKDAVVKSEVIDDAKDLGNQFAEPFVDLWAGITVLAKKVKSELVD
jgi:hypothetical protein